MVFNSAAGGACSNLMSRSLGRQAVVNPVQDLLRRSLPTFLQHGGGIGSWQDGDQPFKGKGYPGDTHCEGKVDEAVRPGADVVHVIVWLTDPRHLTRLVQEHHWRRCRHKMPLGGGSGGGVAGRMRVRGGSGSSHCSAETWGVDWTRSQTGRWD